MPIETKLIPVEILLGKDNQTNSLGIGTYFLNNNQGYIITCEHLFLKEFGTSEFFFRSLRPYKEKLEGISEFASKELAIRSGEKPDTVVLKTGPVNSLVCYSERGRKFQDKESDLFKIKEGGKPKLYSLVTGEEVSVVGGIKSTDDGTTNILIEYESVSGESGTGFVDKEGNLFILNSDLLIPKEQKDYCQKHLGSKNKLSRVYGPIRLKVE